MLAGRHQAGRTDPSPLLRNAHMVAGKPLHNAGQWGLPGSQAVAVECYKLRRHWLGETP
jgi:hypothetical protein